MMALYRIATAVIAPALPFYLKRRQRRGKEDAARISERFGNASLPRPAGKLVWLHAASVGEASAAQPLIEKIAQRFPQLNVLLTTGTVTSAQLMRRRLPARALHQFVPLDTPAATARFMRHWQPDFCLWVESELWPNLIDAAAKQRAKLFLINARMSTRSFTRWKRFPFLIRPMLSRFTEVYAQSEEDAARFRALGAARVQAPGNLKYDNPPLSADAAALKALEEQTGTRPRWLAASTHDGEELAVAKVHEQLKPSFPGLLTFIVPRHPARADAIAEQVHGAFPGLNVVRRSRNSAITAQTDIYIADTMGELGLFYRLNRVVFVGGSLVTHGGQNPLEPARIGCAVLFGPHMENFNEMKEGLLAAQAAREIDSDSLPGAVRTLLADDVQASAMAQRGAAWTAEKSGVSDALLVALALYFQEAVAHVV